MGTEIADGKVSALEIGAHYTGTCRAWFDRGRGYGFVRVDGVREELFVPARNIVNAAGLDRGDRVRFDVRMGYDGKLMADNVELVTVEPWP
ncbi:MAG: cold shock domain-containing protein [Acidobacteriota bacterium]|nr:cold shock domain-containing protein [Acidobacteriota bacterium]